MSRKEERKEGGRDEEDMHDEKEERERDEK